MNDYSRKTFCIDIKGVFASKINDFEYVIMENTNPYSVDAEYRVFGLRYDANKPDLLTTGIITLAPVGNALAIKDVSTGYDSNPEYEETYYTVIVDIIRVEEVS